MEQIEAVLALEERALILQAKAIDTAVLAGHAKFRTHDLDR